MSVRHQLNWNNTLTCGLLVACLVLGSLLVREEHGASAGKSRAPVGRAVVLPSSPTGTLDFAAEDELLARRIPISVLNQARTLEQAIRSIAEAAHCNAIVDWKTLESVTMDQKTPFALSMTADDLPNLDVTVEQAMRWVIGSYKTVDLAYAVENGTLIISMESALTKHTIIYDVRDLIEAAVGAGDERSSAMEQLYGMIRDNVAPQTWTMNGGTTGSVQLLMGLMVITQTAPNHHRILRFLEGLRTAARAAPDGRRETPLP